MEIIQIVLVFLESVCLYLFGGALIHYIGEAIIDKVESSIVGD